MPGPLSRLLPRSLIARVYALYSAALLVFVGLGLGLFYQYQFEQQVEDNYRAASMLVEVAAQVVGESAVIGDYDTIRRTLDRVIPSSQFASALFIDLNGGIVRSENRAVGGHYAPAWLQARLAEHLVDINRSLVVGGTDYGVLRLRFDSGAVAADLWRLILGALVLAGFSLIGGLLLIWFPLKRWLGTLENVDRLTLSAGSLQDAGDVLRMIEEVPLEFRHLFERLAQTLDHLAKELAAREKAVTSLRGLLETLVPDVAREPAADAGDLEAVTRMISELVVEREASRVALDNQKFALDQHAIVSITDATGRILYANDRFCSSSGYAREELLDRTHALLASGVHPPAFFEAMWTRLRAGQVWQGEICNRARDGRLLWYSSTIVPLAAPGQAPDQFIGISTDITERKAAEAEAQAARHTAEQASLAKSQFLANMSHEIRTPMNGILGMTELALETPLTHEQREYLTLVKSSADALLGIINDILDFSKIEAGKMSIEAIPFELPQAVREAVRSLGLRAYEKGLSLTCDIAPEVPTLVVGDPGRLRQVLINLIGNAVKFTPQGEIAVSVRVDRRLPGQAVLAFAVRDTGIGIAPDKQSQIFEAFAQEDASTTRKYGGTGLGLSISSRLVDLMGGRMWLESTPGVGSTFHFTMLAPLAELPAASGAADASATGAEAVPAADSTAPARKGRILLVEDNPVNQRLAVALLERRGWQVQVAGNGELALRAVENEPAFDAILMDMQMPVMDGLEATRHLRARERALGLARSPIIAMTANAMTGDRERCLDAGMDDYLSKPIRASDLEAVLARWTDAAGATPAA